MPGHIPLAPVSDKLWYLLLSKLPSHTELCELPQRILGTLAYNMAHNIPSPRLCLTIAAWIRYVSGTDEVGQPIDVRDPMTERLRDVTAAGLTPSAKAAAVLEMTEIFPAELAAQIAPMVISATEQIWKSGARGAIVELAGNQL